MAAERPYVLQWRSAVFNSQLSCTVKLALLTLAEWADVDGRNCYPAIPRVAEKASLNEKSVRRALDQADAMGFIARRHKGTAQGWRRFEYTLTLPERADSTPAREPERPDSGSAPLAERADSTPGPSQGTCGLSVPNVRTLSPKRAGTESTDLSITYPIPRKQRARKAALTFRQWFDAVDRDDDKAIPPTHRVHAYAKEAGIPDDFLYLAWRWFVQRYEDDDKRYSDWPKHFLNSVKGVWHGCWRTNWRTGELELTEAGLQLQRQLAAQEAA